MQLRNLADLNHFDVVIPIEVRLGLGLYEIAKEMAEAGARRFGNYKSTIKSKPRWFREVHGQYGMVTIIHNSRIIISNS